jgi:hypothetical protein
MSTTSHYANYHATTTAQLQRVFTYNLIIYHITFFSFLKYSTYNDIYIVAQSFVILEVLYFQLPDRGRCGRMVVGIMASCAHVGCLES